MSDIDQVTPAATASPGAILVAARERMGMTQEQVAAELKIQIKKIQALEADNFHLMFSEVFARGYLRSYAKLLRIDGEQLVQMYIDAHGTEETPVPVHDSLNLSFTSGSSPWAKRLLLVAVIAVVWGLAYWFFSEESTDPAPVVERAVERTNELSAAPAVAPSEPLVFDQAPVVEAIPDVEPVVSAEPSLDVLQLSFAEECWLDVQDANGDVLATDLQAPGSRVTLTGVAPFSVRLGNYAQGVSATVNGETIDLPARAPTAVVTFQMGSAREAN